MIPLPDKGALIYGRSPYRISFSLRSNRSDSKESAGRVPSAGLMQAALLRGGRSCADSTKGAQPFWITRKGLCPLDSHPQYITKTESAQFKLTLSLQIWFCIYTAMLNGRCPCRRWLPARFHLEGVKVCHLNNPPAI